MPSSSAFLRHQPVATTDINAVASRRALFAVAGGAADGGGGSGGARTALAEVSGTGEFKRRDAAWRNWISREEGARHPPEAGRYHLFVAYAWYVYVYDCT